MLKAEGWLIGIAKAGQSPDRYKKTMEIFGEFWYFTLTGRSSAW